MYYQNFYVLFQPEENSDKDEQVLDIDNVEKKVVTSTVREKLKDLSVDYARGGGQIFTDSSSSEEDTSDDDENDVGIFFLQNLFLTCSLLILRRLNTLGVNLTKTQKRRTKQLCGLRSATWIGTESGQTT